MILDVSVHCEFTSRTTYVVALQKSRSLTLDVRRLGGCLRSSRRTWTHFTFYRNMSEGTRSLSCFGETELLYTVKGNDRTFPDCLHSGGFVFVFPMGGRMCVVQCSGVSEK